MIPDNSKMHLLRIITGNLSYSTFKIHLFTNDITPSATDNKNTYTELSGGNYTSIELDKTLWTYTPTAPVFGSYGMVSFILSDIVPETNVYGYFITADNRLLWSERFAMPWSFNEDGDTLQITVKLGID